MRPGSSADARRRTGVVVGLILGASFPAAAIHGAGAKIDPSGAYAIRWWTIEDGQVPDWPVPGTVIRIPAGATVPDIARKPLDEIAGFLDGAADRP